MSRGSPVYISELIDQLRREYNQIQSKIDKIGEFKFKVRGWAVTILSGFAIGVFSYEIPWYLVFFVIPILMVFHYLEREQHISQSRLEARISDIEYVIERFSVDKDEPFKKKRILDVKSFERIRYSPRFGSLMGASGRISVWRFLRDVFNVRSKENWLYYFLYVLTALLFLVRSISIEDRNEIEVERQRIEMHFNGNQETAISKSMKQRPKENVEEEMYSLVSQIDFGDITDISLYWNSLANALLKLKIEGWRKPIGNAKVSEILESMKEIVEVEGLIKITRDMEKLSKSGSNPSEENLESLQHLAIDFENKFEKFIKKLPADAK